MGGQAVRLACIFLTLFAYAVALLMHCLHSLPETLPRHARRPIGIGVMTRQFVAAFGDRRFRLVALAMAYSFAGLFLYAASAPTFAAHELDLLPTSDYLLSVKIGIGV